MNHIHINMFEKLVNDSISKEVIPDDEDLINIYHFQNSDFRIIDNKFADGSSCITFTKGKKLDYIEIELYGNWDEDHFEFHINDIICSNEEDENFLENFKICISSEDNHMISISDIISNK